MIELLRTWWPVMLLLYVPTLVHSVMRIVVTRAYRRLDESHPDDLEHVAGTWLSHEIMRQGLRGYVRTIVTDNNAKLSSDMFHPLQSVIQLEADTHFKRDPMHWAIAAHELGHARVHRGFPVLGRLTIVALYIKHALVAAATALVISNVAFALPHVTDVAFVLFAAAAVLHLVKLADEIAASCFGMQSLRASPHCSWSHMRSARLLLVLAFSTYLVSFLSQVLLLTQWPLVEALTRVPMVPPVVQLTTVGVVLAALATVVLVAASVAHAASLVRQPRGRLGAIGEIAQLLAKPVLLGFVLLVWNIRADVDYAFYVALALVPIGAMIVALLMLPITIVDRFVVHRIAKRLVVDPVHRTPELERDLAHGETQRKRGNSALDDLLAKARIPLEHRIAELLQFSYIPLLVVFWLS